MVDINLKPAFDFRWLNFDIKCMIDGKVQQKILRDLNGSDYNFFKDKNLNSAAG